jgi:outer membrane protein TolC
VGGVGHVVDGAAPNPDFVGGYGKAFAQTLQHDFPNNIATIGISAPIGNRGAQADYGIDQLQYRQSQVVSQKDINAIVVDVAARVAALRQAHAGYDAARDTRTLEEQLLAADQQRFASGGENTTFDTLMADQRALVTAQIAEVNALAAYARARTSLDHVLGETLDKNHITLEEGLNGRVDRQPQLPGVPDRGK